MVVQRDTWSTCKVGISTCLDVIEDADDSKDLIVGFEIGDISVSEAAMKVIGDVAIPSLDVWLIRG